MEGGKFGDRVKQEGFTLIELIVVLVILGFIAAYAAAKYQNLHARAARAAADKVFGAASSAVATNFAARLASPGSSNPVVDGETLLATMESGLVEGWTANTSTTNALSGSIGGTTYNISIPTVEDAIPTRRAVLRAEWH